jgi:hypothetical protein
MENHSLVYHFIQVLERKIILKKIAIEEKRRAKEKRKENIDSRGNLFSFFSSFVFEIVPGPCD